MVAVIHSAFKGCLWTSLDVHKHQGMFMDIHSGT